MNDAKERVEKELEELVIKHEALKKFIEVEEPHPMVMISGTFYRNGIMNGLPQRQKDLLLEQQEVMRKYRETLVLRLHYWGKK